MNFYQRANLNLNLAITVALVNSAIRLDMAKIFDGDYASDNREILVWIGFQFLFCVKTLVDDHNHFEEGTYKEKYEAPQSRFVDFLYFVFFGFFMIAAAAFSHLIKISMGIFMIGIIISTAWLVQSHKSDFFKKTYFYLNLIYFFLLFEFIRPFDISITGFIWQWLAEILILPLVFFLLMFLALVFDVIASHTPTKMP